MRAGCFRPAHSMTAMHPLLRLALATCPRDYRREYEQSIAIDMRVRHENVFAVALDLICQGFGMRVEGALRDLSFALRTLAKAPMYTVVAVLAIALAIGGNVAVTSVLEGVLLKPLPYPNADRLVHVDADAGIGQFSYLDARDFRAEQTTLERFGLIGSDSRVLSGKGRPVTLNGSAVDEGYFAVLEAHPQIGRLLNGADRGAKTIVLADKTWRTYFSGDPRVIGTTATLNGMNYTIVGVAKPGMRDISPQGLSSNAYWVPLNPRGSVETQRGYTNYDGWALLRRGVSVRAASADAQRVLAAIVHRYPANHGTWTRAQVSSAFDLLVGPVRQMLWLLYAAVTVLLVIACANIVNLTLVRAAARERELVVRSALGASRGRIAVQLIVEMGVIALAGGVLGIGLGFAGLRLFDAIGAQMIPRWEGVRVDGGVIAYVALLLAATSVLTGAIPALTQRRELVQGLRAAGRSGDLSGAKRLRTGLVIAEIALTLGLVTSAGLIVRSFETLTHVNLGFDARHLYTIEIPSMPKSAYPNYDAQFDAARRLVAAVRSVPGVQDAAATTIVPFKGGFVVNTTVPGKSGIHEVDGNAVAPEYFRVMRVPLVRGRSFTPRDGPHAQSVAMVNEALARQLFGTLDVVGRHIRPGVSSDNTPSMVRTIVGVVGNTRNGFSQAMRPEFYLPLTQLQALGLIIARTDGHDAGFARAIDRAYASVDPSFPAPEIVSYDTLFAQDAGRWRAAAMLFSTLAVIALILALAGIYAVSAYAVQQRTQEFGIRKAIGARDRAVLGGVLLDALRFAAAGIVLGALLAAMCTRYLNSLLFETSPLDPVTFTFVVALIVACTVLAALIPALRATRIQPASALRYE